MPEISAVSQKLLAEAFERALKRERRSPLTVKTYLNIVRRFLRAYGSVALDAITPEHIERFLDGLNVAPSTYRVHCERLRAFFNWCADEQRLIRRNPVAQVRRPKVKKRRRPSFSREEFQAIRRRCRTLEEAALVEVAYWTGVRISELRALRVKDVDLERRRIHVWKGKGDDYRPVPFPKPAARVLRAYIWRHLLLHPDLYLFRNPKQPHQPRGSHWIERTLRRLGREAGIPFKTTAHVFRHSFAKLMKTLKVPMDATQQMMGHADIATTASVYGELTAEEIQAIYDGTVGPVAEEDAGPGRKIGT